MAGTRPSNVTELELAAPPGALTVATLGMLRLKSCGGMVSKRRQLRRSVKVAGAVHVVHGAVYGALHGAVHVAVHVALDVAVCGAVNAAVHGAAHGAVHVAMHVAACGGGDGEDKRRRRMWEGMAMGIC